MKSKTIYLLIGPKGSGKTFIGSLMDNEFGIRFIRVEDWAKEIKRDRHVHDQSYLEEVFLAIEHGIRESMITHNKIVFESTGLTMYFDRMLINLRNDFNVITIRVAADPETCLARIKTRDQHIHIDLSDDQLVNINKQVEQRNLPTDFKLHNNTTSKEAIITALTRIVNPE